MIAVVSPGAYGAAVLVGSTSCIGLCMAARRSPGRWTDLAADGIGVLLVADAVSWTVSLVVRGSWSAQTDLPLALCNMALLVAAAACVTRRPTLVELTWFWGMTGTLQAVITPDLSAAFPRLTFFQYTVGHVGIVLAALFLVVGLGIHPRRGAVARVIAITAAYTAFVGAVDALTNADYMFLRSPPANWSLLSILGPWPWYIASAGGVGIVLFLLLDAPFRAERHHRGPHDHGSAGPLGDDLLRRPRDV